MTYQEFIQNIIDTREQWNIPADELYENHHIIPQCLGGMPKYFRHTTKHSNLIWLTFEEHYTAHKLLCQEYPENKKLAQALWRLETAKNFSISTPEEYAIARTNFINSISGENHPFYKKHRDEQTKRKISKTEKGKIISEEQKKYYSEHYSGINSAWYGKHHSDETKQKLSQ